jgi:hypothetical protein
MGIDRWDRIWVIKRWGELLTYLLEKIAYD